MSNVVRIESSTKLELDKIKDRYNFKSFGEVIEKITSFINKNDFDISRDYSNDWHNLIEKSNDKTLKRIEDVIRIIRNIEKDSIVPTSIRVNDIYNNSNSQFKNEVINEVKKDFVLDKPAEIDLDKFNIEMAQLKKSRDNYAKELNDIRPLINELFNSITAKTGLMGGGKLEINISVDRYNEIKNMINK